MKTKNLKSKKPSKLRSQLRENLGTPPKDSDI